MFKRQLFFMFGMVCLLLVLFTSPVSATEVTLTWNPSENATGYKVYVGSATRVYDYKSDDSVIGDSPFDAKTNMTWKIIIPKKQDDTKYFFAVTAYNIYGESGYSNEVTCTVFGAKLVPVSPVLIKKTIKYDNGDVVEFDYVNRTVTTSLADGSTPTVKTF